MSQQDIPNYLCGESQWETEENTELFLAASEGDSDRLRVALNNGANANYWDKSDEKLGTLHAAARSKVEGADALISSALINAGARVSAALISNRNEPIHEAANAGAEGVCRVLIDASPKCAESQNAYGNTALLAATRSGSADVVSLLLDRGADINKVNNRGSSALHLACFLAQGGERADPYLKIGAILLCNEILDMDICDVNGYTPLHIAAQRGCDELVELLIDSGASLTAKTGVDKKGRGARTPLGMAKFGCNDRTIEIIEQAMAKGEQVVTKKMARELLGGS
ncbi:hypothetical protein ACHAWF_011451 [Thalassiosira exigua]